MPQCGDTPEDARGLRRHDVHLSFIAGPQGRQQATIRASGESMSYGHLFLAVIGLTLFAPAQAMPIRMDFTFSGLGVSAGNAADLDPVIGSIVWEADSVSSPIHSLTSIDLAIDGHTYVIGEIDFIDPWVSTHANIFGTLNDTSVHSQTNDFWITWTLNTLTLNSFVYASANTEGIWPTIPGETNPTGILEFSSFSITAVPLPTAVWLFGSALGLLGWLGRRTA